MQLHLPFIQWHISLHLIKLFLHKIQLLLCFFCNLFMRTIMSLTHCWGLLKSELRLWLRSLWSFQPGWCFFRARRWVVPSLPFRQISVIHSTGIWLSPFRIVVYLLEHSFKITYFLEIVIILFHYLFHCFWWVVFSYLLAFFHNCISKLFFKSKLLF